MYLIRSPFLFWQFVEGLLIDAKIALKYLIKTCILR